MVFVVVVVGRLPSSSFQIKPANILVNEDCACRIADFGMARLVSDGADDKANDMTEYVVSRWWRGPEVMLFGSYSFPLDIWSFGCVVAEMLLRKPLFAGKDYADQLVKILSILGKPPPAVRKSKPADNSC